MEALWFVLFFSAFTCAALSARVASSKGLESNGWGLAGFLLGPLALIAVAGMPDKKLRRLLFTLAEHQGASVMEEASDLDTVTGEADESNGFSTYWRASEDEIWTKAILSLGNEISDIARREKSEITPNNIVIKDQDGKILARASYTGNTSGMKKWQFRYIKPK